MRRWKTEKLPTLTDVVRTTNLHTAYETMFDASQNKYGAKHQVWKPWMEWYGNNKARL